MVYQQAYQPTRKAILIGSPGRGNNRLQGVSNDLLNFCEFLMSPRGGVWYEQEIVVLDDPSLDEVITEINKDCVDYQQVYYSGHGYQDIVGNDFVCLRNYNLHDNYLFNENGPRQFIIEDSCRKYYHTISGFPKEIERWKYASGYSAARALFDKYILHSPPGKMKMFAASPGQVALDNRDGYGGEFTLALLKGIYETNLGHGYHAIFPQTALDKAKRILLENKENQIPQLIQVEGNLQVPLGLASSEFLRKDVVETNRLQMQQQFERSRRMQNNQTAVGLGIAAVVLLALFNQD